MTGFLYRMLITSLLTAALLLVLFLAGCGGSYPYDTSCGMNQSYGLSGSSCGR